MGQQPVRGQRPRQPASQPRLVGQHPQQRRPRRASSRLNPARGAPVDHMGGFGNAQRNAVTAAAIAITLTRRIAEPGRTEQPFRRGKMAATGPGRADHIGGSARVISAFSCHSASCCRSVRPRDRPLLRSGGIS
jgi:hypothetical protein